MKIGKLLLLFVTCSLAACGQFSVSIEPLSTAIATDTLALPTQTSTVASPSQSVPSTATVVIASPTLAQPTAAPTQPASTVLAPTSTTASEQMVKIVLIALEDNGQSGALVGCGDSAIPVNVTIPPTQGVLRAALEKLFSAKQQFYGESGYYNALYQSDLSVTSVSIDQGTATIRLNGTIMVGGTCDAPRIEAQIEQTALQFSTVSDVVVFVNDVLLEDVLSTR